MAFEISARHEPLILAEYTEMYEIILSACDLSEDGFWIDPGTPLERVVEDLARLFAPDVEFDSPDQNPPKE